MSHDDEIRQLENEAGDSLAWFVYGLLFACLVIGAVTLHGCASRGMLP